MTTDLEAIRRAWLVDRPVYDKLVAYLKPKMETLLKVAGIWGKVDGRPRTWTVSLRSASENQILPMRRSPIRAELG